MLAFARCEFELGERQADGATAREHYEKIWKQTGGDPPEPLAKALKAQCPEETRYLWETFLSMSLGRKTGERGPEPLGSLEVRAWEQRYGVRLLPWEHAAIDGLEATYLEHCRDVLTKATQK